ncbi:MAG: hypothetical protein H6551_09115 [Chitinophagales bacterium]|nr:hypothetical protein [Chitinophagaceae bacterium]MCB9065281.1 hypothetical protein [Chitinophagales bacterium]
MLRNLIIESYPIILVLLIALYAFAKNKAMKSSGVRSRNRLNAFFRSFFPIPKQAIKNMTNNRLGDYFKKSNRINYRFYGTLVFFTIIYMLMKAIS